MIFGRKGHNWPKEAESGGLGGDELEGRNEPTTESEAALRERLAVLSQASLRINESLDFDTVLQGALDDAIGQG